MTLVIVLSNQIVIVRAERLVVQRCRKCKGTIQLFAFSSVVVVRIFFRSQSLAFRLRKFKSPGMLPACGESFAAKTQSLAKEQTT